MLCGLAATAGAAEVKVLASTAIKTALTRTWRRSSNR